MKYIKIMIASLGISLFALVPAFGVIGLASAADIQGSLCQGANLEAGTGDGDCTVSTSGSSEKINSIVSDVINIFSWIVGVVCVIMVIYGGFKYVTAGGDTTKVGEAKNTILYALVGLVIVALAQVIVKFVLSKVTASPTQ